MPQVNIFRWQVGRGWIVLSGGGAIDADDTANIEAHLLSRTVSQGPVVYVWAADDIDAADRHMDSLRELGARTGYLVDLMTETDDELSTRISEAGVIIIGDGPYQDDLYQALTGVALDSIRFALSRGATLYALGRSAELFGAYRLGNKALQPGFDWVQHAIIISGYTPEMADQMRDIIRHHPQGFGIGLGQGAALALGPGGQVEVWGNAAVTISLGQDYTHDTPPGGGE